MNSPRDYCWHHWFSIFVVQDDGLIYDTRRICLKVEFVGVVPNSLQDIGRASDGANRRPVAGGLISWRLDSLVSRRRRVTQTLEIVRSLLAGARGFSPSHWRGFPRKSCVYALIDFILHTSFITAPPRDRQSVRVRTLT